MSKPYKEAAHVLRRNINEFLRRTKTRKPGRGIVRSIRKLQRTAEILGNAETLNPVEEQARRKVLRRLVEIRRGLLDSIIRKPGSPERSRREQHKLDCTNTTLYWADRLILDVQNLRPEE